MHRPSLKFFRLALAVVALGALAGCDTLSNLNPFNEKETPLPGDRRPVPRVTAPPPNSVPQPLSALPAAAPRNLA